MLHTNQLRYLGDNLFEGDVILSNHPCAGGSHLPDLTVITPVSYTLPPTLCSFLPPFLPPPFLHPFTQCVSLSNQLKRFIASVYTCTSLLVIIIILLTVRYRLSLPQLVPSLAPFLVPSPRRYFTLERISRCSMLRAEVIMLILEGPPLGQCPPTHNTCGRRGCA